MIKENKSRFLKKDTKKPRMLLERAREILRLKHYSIRTEKAYIAWMRRYLMFHNKRHPRETGVPEIEAFLSHLAINDNVAGSTQNQGTLKFGKNTGYRY